MPGERLPRRRRARQKRKKEVVVVTQPARAPRRRRRRGRGRIGKGLGATREGMQFLRAVLAPYDFAQDGCAGVPDEYSGPAFPAQQRVVNVFSGDAVSDTFFAILPTPQVAFWKCLSAVGLSNSSVFTGVPFPQQQAVRAAESSGSLGTASMIRVIGLEVEIKSTGPALTTSGVLYGRKAEMRLAESKQVEVKPILTGTVKVVDDSLVPEGLVSNFTGMTVAPHYTGTIRTGYFAVAAHRGPWTFAEPIDLRGSPEVSIPNSEVSPTDGVLTVSSTDLSLLGGSFDWYDPGMQGIFIHIPKNVATNQYTLEVIMQLEIKPCSSSFFANLVRPSPTHDPFAIAAYEKLAEVLPHGVTAAQNANFWQHILSLAKTGGFIFGRVPGPVGLLGSGVESLATGLEALLFPEGDD